MRPFSKEFFERTRELMVVFDTNNRFEEVSKPWEAALGWTIEELKTKTYIDLLHPDDVTKSTEAAEANKQNKYRGTGFENRYLHKNGSYIWLQWDGMFGADGRLYAIARDITPLKEKEFFFEEMQKIAKIGFWKVNINTSEATVSDEIFRIHEVPYGTPFDITKGITFFPAEVQDFVREKAKNLAEKKEPYDMELPFITAKGNHRVVRVIGRCAEKGDVREVYGLFQDVTDEVQKQKELNLQRTKNINASKMASLGEMAANIAHEINNPLSLIQGRAEYLSSKLKSSSISNEDLITGLNQIHRTSSRISKIIKSLRMFSKADDQSAFIKVSLKNILEDSFELCATKIKNDGYDLIMDQISDVELKCRGSQLCQVFLNLINNSVEALEDKDEKWIKIQSKIKNGLVFIEFVDSGFGIDKSIENRIMEPFFTTKGNLGTGLGLSIANSIVTNHKGRMYYDSSKERTTFCIELPCEEMVRPP